MKILDTNIYLGSSQIFKIYKGDTIVYQKGSAQPDYFKITALTSTSVQIDWVSRQLQYRINNGEWVAPDDDSVSLNTDDVMEIARTMGRETVITETFGLFTFQTGSEVSLSGNIMSLLADDFENFTDLTGWGDSYDGIFKELFYNNNAIVDASDLILPATTLADYCYLGMFKDCVSLTSAPELPATELATYCYLEMFSGCSSLSATPELPATEMAYGCYTAMFSDCTSLTATPELPATILDDACYSRMFRFCSNLTTAPEILPATELAYDCYQEMFYYCQSLTTAPELPATELVDGCYGGMFNGCTLLNYIKCLATDNSADDCTTNWLNDVSATGDFYMDSTATWTSGPDGVPINWTTHIV